MCTVTFVPSKNGIFLTSNRDETRDRIPACLPEAHNYHGCELIYPEDPQGGGSWIALKANGDSAVLLNGGFIKHEPEPPYRKSRGWVLIDILGSSNPVSHFRLINLNGIEPFTLILLIACCLWEVRWDGLHKYCVSLPADKPHIWSSVMLYGHEVVLKREQWFREWWESTKEIHLDSVLDFHRYAGNGDVRNDLVMYRANQKCTVSITTICNTRAGSYMIYKDLKNEHR